MWLIIQYNLTTNMSWYQRNSHSLPSFVGIIQKLISYNTHTHTHTHTHPFYSPLDFVRDYPGEPVTEPIWILLKQETVSGSGISWALCKSEPRPRQINMPAPTTQFFHRPDALPAA